MTLRTVDDGGAVMDRKVSLVTYFLQFGCFGFDTSSNVLYLVG